MEFEANKIKVNKIWKPSQCIPLAAETQCDEMNISPSA
jgi:hypothetical protein